MPRRVANPSQTANAWLYFVVCGVCHCMFAPIACQIASSPLVVAGDVYCDHVEVSFVYNVSARAPLEIRYPASAMTLSTPATWGSYYNLI
ncbi:hypothetical protein PF010_g10151 [Phytophthora fragariae]|uniref:Uncharacterized protein n=1 Tax=Phytophthora fragariae TaxID=53985 RepID=A0A6G0P2Q0_9STRA|nr:hypothetical protein PF010_g10151 [Phytophthora fragariae]KAE9232790.1 hypothetical protein PF004_g9835 [Phytophthora fragariae]